MVFSQQLFNKLIEALKKSISKYAEIAEFAYSENDELPDFQIAIVGNPCDSEKFIIDKIINWG